MLQVSSKERKNNNNLNIWLANVKKKLDWSTIEGSCGSYCTAFIFWGWNQIEITCWDNNQHLNSLSNRSEGNRSVLAEIN